MTGIADAGFAQGNAREFIAALGAPVTFRAPDGTVHDTGADGAPLRAILRGIDRTAFEAGDFGGAVVTDQSVKFATADLPEASEGWLVIDGSGQAFTLDAVRSDGRGMSIASVQPATH